MQHEKYGRLGFQANFFKNSGFFHFQGFFRVVELGIEKREGTYSHDTKSPFA